MFILISEFWLSLSSWLGRILLDLLHFARNHDNLLVTVFYLFHWLRALLILDLNDVYSVLKWPFLSEVGWYIPWCFSHCLCFSNLILPFCSFVRLARDRNSRLNRLCLDAWCHIFVVNCANFSSLDLFRCLLLAHVGVSMSEATYLSLEL